MNRRTIVVAVLGGLLALAALGVFLDPTRTVLGYFRGEAFFQGRPTSFWRNVLVSDDNSALRSVEAVPVLTASLRDRNLAVRARAANVLGDIGPPAVAAVPALLQSMKDADGKIDATTLDYLKKVAEMKAKHPGLEVEIEFDTPETVARYTAAEAVKKIDPAAAQAAGIP